MSGNISEMDPDAKREAALFQAAAQLTGQARKLFLDGSRQGDAALRARLEALLAAHDQPEGVLGETAPDEKGTVKIELDNELHDETIGSTIGHYKVLQSIGEGGCQPLPTSLSAMDP